MAAGAILLAICAAGLLHQAIASRFALWQFDRAQAATKHQRRSTTGPSKTEPEVDFSMWAEKRIQAYRDSLASKADPPLAVLEIDKLRIRVPVFEGTDDLTLNRGVGRIVGTAKLGKRETLGSRDTGMVSSED